MAFHRRWRIAICLLLCLCMAFSCVGSVYATELLPFIVMPSMPIVSSILIASGIKSLDEKEFNDLCTSIDTSLNLEPNLKMTVDDDKTYLATNFIESVVNEAVKLKAFSPVGKPTFSLGDVKILEIPSNTDFDQFVKANFVSRYTVSAVPKDEIWIPITGPYGWRVEERTMSSNDFGLNCKFTIGPMSTVFYYLKTFNFYYANQQLPIEFGNIFRKKNDYNYGYYTTFRIAGVISSVSIGYFSDDRFNKDMAGGSISVRFPWEVTDDLPGVSSAGTLDSLNARWLALERDLAGVRSIPLSVPADTVAGAAAQTQAEAQAGTKTKDVAFDVVKDSAASDFINKGKLSLGITDFFPFCIPFDIIKGVQLLVAPPKDPVFDIPINFPYLPQQTIHVDLTQFAGLAVISRWFLTLVFVWGLAAGTSKVMKW